MLLSGIKLNFDKRIDAAERIFINTGAIPIKLHEDFPLKGMFDDTSYLPKLDWHPIKPIDMPKLCDIETPDYLKYNISVFPVDDNITDTIKQLQLEGSTSKEDINNRLINNKAVLAKLDNLLSTYIKKIELTNYPGTTYVQGFYVSPPKLPTVSFIKKTNSYLGLHIDYSVDYHKLYKKETVNRLCINIGCQPRYLVILNLGVNQLVEMINKVSYHDFTSQYESRDLPEIVNKFFSYYPDYPLIKIKIHPCEAYIAPTDNFIHDGSTYDMTEYDLSLSLLGMISPLIL